LLDLLTELEYRMSTSKSELDDFIRFATSKLDSDHEPASLEDLLSQWREQCEYAATVEDIRQGLDDIKAGKGQSVEDAFRDVRQQLGLSD
jgi:hypothetical protein